MPYSSRSGGFERSRSIGHVPIVENTFIKDRLRSYKIFGPTEVHDVPSQLLVSADTLGIAGDPHKWAMAFDGSPQEVAVDDRFPSTRVGYVQIAGVLVDLETMLGQSTAHLVDPTVIRNTIKESLHSMVLPGSNVCRNDMPTVKDSWRAEIYEMFRDYKVEDLTLLHIFMMLVKLSDKSSAVGDVILERCSASETCTEVGIRVPIEGTTCRCGRRLFPTDALRIHEEVSEEHENATALGRLMTCLEHIIMIGYIQYLWQRLPRILGSVGFVRDGALALFGPQAWLHTAILKFLHSLNASLTDRNQRFPVIVGVEKGGQFAEHGQAIADRIPVRTVMCLPDEYVYKHILTFKANQEAVFGKDTYYGQKFFYRTSQGQLLTVTVPKIARKVSDPEDPRHYPWMPDTLAFLDRIGTSLYQDAIIPVALAHSFASIPLRAGSKVLTLLSRQELAQPNLS